MRLRDGGEFLFVDGFFDALGNEGLQDFALDVFGEAAADQCERSFAGAEAGDARDLGEFFGDAFSGFGDFVGGDFEFKFAAAGIVCDGGGGFSSGVFRGVFSVCFGSGVFCGVFGGAVSHAKNLSEARIIAQANLKCAGCVDILPKSPKKPTVLVKRPDRQERARSNPVGEYRRR